MKKLLGIAFLLTVVALQPARAQHIFNFDENGNGTFTLNGGAPQAFTGVLATDPSSNLGPVLTFDVATPWGSTVGAGDVLIYEDAAKTILGDVLRFTDAKGDLTGVNADRMIFYSLAGEGLLADTGLPNNVDLNAASVVEGAGESFSYGDGRTFAYNGISGVPEPSSMALLGTAMAGLWVARERRTKSAA